MNVSKTPAAPSARIHRVAGATTPLAPVPPAYGVPASGKNIDRSTTMSAGVEVSLTTAETWAEAAPFNAGNSRRRLTVRRPVAGRVKTFSSAVPEGVITASGAGSSFTVMLSVLADGLPTRMSSSKVPLLAPSARNQVLADCAAAGRPAPAHSISVNTKRVQKEGDVTGSGAATVAKPA